MARKTIDIGTIGNDGTGDSIRDAFRKVNDNFRELYSSLGLGQKLSFLGLSDVPGTGEAQWTDVVEKNTLNPYEMPILSVNDVPNGVVFKKLKAGVAISLDFNSDNEIVISSDFGRVSQDISPRLGGDLKAGKPGLLESFRILELGTPEDPTEAVNKSYADSKISLAGVDAIDPETRVPNAAFGRMTGPLILSRNPVQDDDDTYNGFIAATKNYVDQRASVSNINLYVSISGVDERPDVEANLQGRSLALSFRTIEAALKKAEEVLKESPLDIGPYEKLLTYNNGRDSAFLRNIVKSPDDKGTGFQGQAFLSVDTVTLAAAGDRYYPGDILEVDGGTLPSGGGRIRIRVLSTLTTPGPIASFKVVSTGVYSGALPSINNATTSVVQRAAPDGINVTGLDARFNLTFKVSSVNIINAGSNYGLVSVRITGGGGSGAFGVANVSNSQIASISITDSGSGFTSFPTVEVDLPRFLIFTDGQRTDFSGFGEGRDLSRSQDLRPGLFIKGRTSGALAQILTYNRVLVDEDGNPPPNPEIPTLNEFFDVDIKSGAFIVGEDISYGDATKFKQVTVLVESGVYEENYPLRVPSNVAVLGDEFRRCLIKPIDGPSSSPWSFIKFRRDPVVDGLNTRNGRRLDFDDTPLSELYGYHYLTDPTKPVYPKINNQGEYNSAARLMALNKRFIQEEVIAWINYRIEEELFPFTSDFVYNSDLCKRDVGLIVDSIIYDLRYGEYNRTVSAALKYYQRPSSLGDPAVAITDQLEETIVGIRKIAELAQFILANNPVPEIFNTTEIQIIDRAFISEVYSGVTAFQVVNNLVEIVVDIIKPEDQRSQPVNFPKNNNNLDLFLCNDATILRRVSGQGHGGFMMVLDPEGQILAKSPYAQECSSFSRSVNAPFFAGGQYVDGFTGNLEFLHEAFLTDPDTNEIIPNRISVSGLDRFPQLPASVIIDDVVYRINYVRNFNYSPEGSTADFELDLNTPWDRDPGPQNVSVVSSTVNVGSFVFFKENHKLQFGATLVFSVAAGGTLPSALEAGKKYYVLEGFTNNTFQVADSFTSRVAIDIQNNGTGQLRYQRLYEVLMPGNRSMLGNDFTQINDLGYGIVANNGGLIEAVSMFSYYNRISMYSINGGQIRSIGGSSAHGDFALVAEGSDPLELPTPTSLYYDLSQSAKAFSSAGTFTNDINGLVLYVYQYDYPPIPGSEIEIVHNIGGIDTVALYTVSQSGFADAVSFPGVVRLDLVPGLIGGATGLLQDVDLDTLVTIRQRGRVILTNDLVNVAVRPSTGLVLSEQRLTVEGEDGNPLDQNITPPVPYRVLNFDPFREADEPFVLRLKTSNNSFSVKETIINISSGNLCTTAKNHRLKFNDKFISDTTSNGLQAGTVYYVVDIPEYNQFRLSNIPSGTPINLTNGNVNITGIKSHRFRENFLIKFEIPDGSPVPRLLDNSNLDISLTYFILPPSGDVTSPDLEFQLTATKGGELIRFSTTQTASPPEFNFRVAGLTETTLREDYAFVRMGVASPGEFREAPRAISTIVNQPLGPEGQVALFTTTAAHGFTVGQIVGIRVRDNNDRLPGSIRQGNYFVLTTPSSTTFTIGLSLGGNPVARVGSDNGVKTFSDSWQIARIKGIAGDSEFGVQNVNSLQRARLIGSTFVFLGTEYKVVNILTPVQTGLPFSRVVLNRPLTNNIVGFASSYNIVAGVTAGTPGAEGNLTIRISLTRVTGHDLLSIGTGSYADTNYPNEIYGPPVNPIQEANETIERDVGRVFFVTTDQFGNFKVGRNFTVDQGTGDVKISANISLSNLASFQFKRGVSVSEFSNDDRFLNADSDVVATALATLRYIDRRLGANSVDNAPFDAGDIVPSGGGFLSLNGLATMKGNLQMGDNNIVNLKDPVNAKEAVNLRSLTFSNFQDFTGNNVAASNLLVFTGVGNRAINAAVTGDIGLTVNSGNNTIDAQITAGSIINADVNSSAAIAQSKLSMNSATTRANADGITQANRGLASFNDFHFTATNGWISVKANGLDLGLVQKISSGQVLGNSSASTADVSEIPFSTVVDQGLAIKKGQYSSIGFLRRISTASNADASWTIVDMSIEKTNNRLVVRDNVDGGFSAGTVNLDRANISTRIDLNSNLLFDGDATSVNLYARNGTAGIRIRSSATVPETNINTYRNASHRFRNAADTADAPIIASSIQVSTLTTGSNTTAGTITGRWTLSGSSPNESRLQATYSADLAEYYEGDKEYDVGTVLVFGGDKEVTVTNIQGDARVAGVVSNTAAFVMYDACPGFKNLLALQGRVPVKVVGKIRKGDMLVTSKIPGVAIAGTDVKVGTVIGKALENYDSDHIGTIEVAVGRT